MNKSGTIYIIKCKDKKIKDCYIGSTTNLELRKQKHKFDCMDGTSKVYKFIKANGNFDNFEFEILEDNIEFDHKKKLNSIERYYIEEFKSSLNMIIPTRTRKEYYEINKDKIKEYKDEYYKNNKDKAKKYYENNKDKISLKITCICGSEFRKDSYLKHCKSNKHLQYIENNN